MSKTNSDYITLNGVRYERVAENSKTVELELRSDLLDAIDCLVADGKYVSRGDAIRHFVRTSMEQSSKKKPKQPVGPKKPSNPPRQPQRPPQRMPQRRGR